MAGSRTIPIRVEESNQRLARLIAQFPDAEPSPVSKREWKLFAWASAIVLWLGWVCYWVLTR